MGLLDGLAPLLGQAVLAAAIPKRSSPPTQGDNVARRREPLLDRKRSSTGFPNYATDTSLDAGTRGAEREAALGYENVTGPLATMFSTSATVCCPHVPFALRLRATLPLKVYDPDPLIP